MLLKLNNLKLIFIASKIFHALIKFLVLNSLYIDFSIQIFEFIAYAVAGAKYWENKKKFVLEEIPLYQKLFSKNFVAIFFSLWKSPVCGRVSLNKYFLLIAFTCFSFVLHIFLKNQIFYKFTIICVAVKDSYLLWY